MTRRPDIRTRSSAGARAIAALLAEAAAQAEADAERTTSRDIADALRLLAAEYRTSIDRIAVARYVLDREPMPVSS